MNDVIGQFKYERLIQKRNCEDTENLDQETPIFHLPPKIHKKTILEDWFLVLQDAIVTKFFKVC